MALIFKLIKPLISIAICLHGFILLAQPSNFTTSEDTFYFTTTTSEFVLYQVFEFENLADSLVFVKWDKEVFNTPQEWDEKVALPPNYFPYVVDTTGIISVEPTSSGNTDLFFVGVFPNGKPGTGVIKIHMHDFYNPTDTLTVVFYATVTGPYLSVNNNPQQRHLVKINRSENQVSLQNIANGSYRVKLIGATGKTLAESSHTASNNAFTFEMPNNLASGIYYLNYALNGKNLGAVSIYWK